MAMGRPLSRVAGMAPGLERWAAGRTMLKPAQQSFTSRWRARQADSTP
jgi:hypothetical protein